MSNELPKSSLSLTRGIAIVLASGGSIWGVVLIAMFGPSVLITPIPFLGYVVTAGYWLRAVVVPSMIVRRAIWALSVFVQGGWLCLSIFDDRTNIVVKTWWMFATVSSAIALAIDNGPEDF